MNPKIKDILIRTASGAVMLAILDAEARNDIVNLVSIEFTFFYIIL